MKDSLPQFSQINPDLVEVQLSQLLNDNLTAIEQRLTQGGPFNWDNFMRLIEDLEDRLHQFWAPVAHLNAVNNTPKLRNAYNACLPKLSDYATKLAHNHDYYEAINTIVNSQHYNSLDFAQKKVIDHILRDFKLSGITLAEEKKKKFAELSKKLSQLTTKFEENILDATQAWVQHVSDEKELDGLPKFAILAARNRAKKNNQDGWLFTLEAPSYLAIMTYAQSRKLRKEAYFAFTTRASDQGPHAGQWDNSNVMFEILKIRLNLAKLLGFNHYAEYSLATKMLKESDQVLTFLNQLLDASLKKAREEFEELKKFASEKLAINELQAWDIAYASEKLRQEQYCISQEDLRPYFPEHQVLNGLFNIAEKLFDITIKQVTQVDVWHPEVKCYVISRHDQPISYFYLDPYSRENKRGGAWMDDCRNRRKLSHDSYQHPIAFIVCNFSPPIENNPALLTHEDVLTLFHEFGHALQQMLTQIDYAEVSGINGIPWDAVEIASQFMENYAWEKEPIISLSEHYETKKRLPDELFKKMNRAKNFQSALQMVRQLQLALFDFHLHKEFDPHKEDSIQKILNTVHQKIQIIPIPKFNRFQHSFSHIFAGGYAAGYYSYKWAEVMAQDAFSLFKEKGIFDKKTGQQFLHTFLEMGGAKEPLDLFIKFRGRPPKVDALLKDSNIK